MTIAWNCNPSNDAAATGSPVAAASNFFLIKMPLCLSRCRAPTYVRCLRFVLSHIVDSRVELLFKKMGISISSMLRDRISFGIRLPNWFRYLSLCRAKIR